MNRRVSTSWPAETEVLHQHAAVREIEIAVVSSTVMRWPSGSASQRVLLAPSE